MFLNLAKDKVLQILLLNSSEINCEKAEFNLQMQQISISINNTLLVVMR